MDVRMLHLMASDVSLTQPANKSFLTIKMRMMTTKPNRNNEGVTEAFIDDMIARGDALKCLGLFADKAKLLARDYEHLTHMYDKQSGEYRGDQVGSFFSFEKVNDEFGVSLYGVARIPKSRKRVCTAITEMWE